MFKVNSIQCKVYLRSVSVASEGKIDAIFLLFNFFP